MHGRRRWTSTLAAIAALALPLCAAAGPVEETYGHATPEEACAAFNREQAELARQQLANNAASLQAGEDATIARQSLIRQQRNAYEIERARREREYQEALARWREDVAACEAGDWSRCAKE